MSLIKSAGRFGDLGFFDYELNGSASNRRRFGASDSVRRAAIAAMFMLSGVTFASWAARIPEAQLQLGLSNQSLGFALLGSAVGALTAMPFAGWLTTVIGSAWLTRISAVGLSLALPVIAAATGFWQLTIVLFIFGAVGNCLNIAINTQASLLEQKSKRLIMSSFHALFSFGGMLGAIGGMAAAFLKIGLTAHFGLIAAVMIILSLIAAPVLLPHDRVPGDETAEKSSVADAAPVARKSYFLLFLLGLIGFCGMFGEGAMADWSAVFLKQSMGTSEGLAAAGFAVYSLTMAAGRLSGDLLRTKFGNLRLLQGGGGLAAGSLLAALIGDSFAISLLAFAGVGLGFSTIVPIIYSAAGKTCGIASGVALSIVSTIGYLGFLFGPPVIGFLAERLNLRIALGIVPVLSLLIVAIAFALKGRSNSEF